MKLSYLGIVMIASLTMGMAIRAQAVDDLGSDLETIQQLMGTIREKFVFKREMKSECNLIISRAKSLQELYQQNGEKGVSSLYRSTLTPYLKTLEEYSRKKNGKADARLIETIQKLNSELNIKLTYARNLKGSYFSDVEVSVDTQISSRPVSGYEVWCVPQGWKGHPDHYERFDNLSTPAAKNLPPGNYFIWAVKGGKSKSAWYPFSFGSDGQKKRWIEVEVAK